MIYELEEQIETLLALTEGEITQEVEKLLESKEAAESWLRAATRAYLNEVARLEGISAELSRITQLRADTNARIERLKGTIGKLTGGEKADLGFAKVSFRSSEAIEIDPDCEEKLPDEYLVPKWHPDKNRLKLALKAGAEIPFCRLVSRKSVIIK
jgi:hypothetical protein